MCQTERRVPWLHLRSVFQSWEEYIPQAVSSISGKVCPVMFYGVLKCLCLMMFHGVLMVFSDVFIIEYHPCFNMFQNVYPFVIYVVCWTIPCLWRIFDDDFSSLQCYWRVRVLRLNSVTMAFQRMKTHIVHRDPRLFTFFYNDNI